MRSLGLAILVVSVSAFTPACSCSHNGATDDMGVGTNDDGGFDIDAFLIEHDGMLPDGYVLPPTADGGIAIQTDGGVFICYIAPCQGKVYQCGDCVDND